MPLNVVHNFNIYNGLKKSNQSETVRRIGAKVENAHRFGAYFSINVCRVSSLIRFCGIVVVLFGQPSGSLARMFPCCSCSFSPREQ